MELLRNEYPQVLRLIYLVIWMVGILVLRSLIRRGLNRRITSTDNKYRARKALNLFVYFLLVLSALVVFSDKLGNIGLFLGVAGAGIAFALQEIIVSFAGWISIIINGNPKVGQRIKIGQVKGDIIDIGVLSTTLLEMGDWVDGDLYNGRIVTFSNSYIFKENLHNYSDEFPFLWDEIQVPIRFGSDENLMKEICNRILDEECGSYAQKSEIHWKKLTNKYRVEDARVKPQVTLKFDENWMTFNLRYVVDYQKRRTTKDRLFTRILQEVKKNAKHIAIATSAVEISNLADLKEKE